MNKHVVLPRIYKYVYFKQLLFIIIIIIIIIICYYYLLFKCILCQLYGSAVGLSGRRSLLLWFQVA